MAVEIKPMQHLLLWHLALGSGGDFLGKVSKIGKPAQRQALVKAGLLAEEKRVNPEAKRATKVKYIGLTEAGWAWCQENMVWPNNARSPQANKILEALLPRLRRALDRNVPIASLGDFINKSAPISPSASAPASDVHQAIRDACKALGDGKEGVRLRIADVRARIQGFSMDDVTQGFWTLSKLGELSLYHMDDPREIQAEDRAAAVKTSTGEEKHIVYFGGKAS